MTIQQLQYVVALDNHRHFVKAAESCYVAQPTLTLQLKKLEEQIDLVIFDRSTHPLKPTPLGEIFIAKARLILQEIEELKGMVNAERNSLEGSFRLGIIPSLAQYLLPLFLADFAHKHPETKLEIAELQSDDIIKKLATGELDLGLLVTPVEESRIREIPLFYEPFMVYAHTNHPLHQKEKVRTDELPENDLWLLEKGHCFRNQTLNICSQAANSSDEKNIKLEGGSLETLKKMIQKMDGYTLMPELAIDPNTDAPYIKVFEDPQPAREVSLIVLNSFTREALLTELRLAILNNTPERYKKNKRFITIKWR